MKEDNVNSVLFIDGTNAEMDLDITTEIHFGKNEHPGGKMISIQVNEQEKYIQIPLDVKDGITLKFEGKGKFNPSSGKFGNLYVVVHIDDKRSPWIKIFAAAILLVVVIASIFLASKVIADRPEPTETAPTTVGPAKEKEESYVCNHDWIPADCTTAKTCRQCNITSGEPLGHKWIDASYDAPKTCSVCKETEGTPLKRVSFKVGEIIKFGTYEQDGNENNGKEPIEWQILKVEGDRALIISRHGLDCKKYHLEYGGTNWKDCSLRYWLNEDFLQEAFTSNEQKFIATTSVDNSASQGNPKWKLKNGETTEDKIFLLSYQEAKMYFGSDESRICKPTKYVIKHDDSKQGVTSNDTGAGWWWLRSPGESDTQAAIVNPKGGFWYQAVSNDYISVRPVLWRKNG